MNRWTMTSFGLIIALLSFEVLYAQDEAIRSETPSDNQGLAERVKEQEGEIIRLKKEITALKQRLESHGKELRTNRMHLITILEEDTAEHEKKRRAAERHTTEERPQHASEECSTETNKIKIIRLENAQAQELAIVIGNLFSPRKPGEELRIAIDTRTNSIILRTSPQQLKEIEAVLQRLDEPENTPLTDEAEDANS